MPKQRYTTEEIIHKLREADVLIATEAIYHRRHPFRAALFVDLDSHELPELPDCRGTSHLTEAPCHC